MKCPQSLLFKYRCKIDDLTSELTTTEQACTKLGRTNADMLRENGKYRDVLVDLNLRLNSLREENSSVIQSDAKEVRRLQTQVKQSTEIIELAMTDMDLMGVLTQKVGFLFCFCSIPVA